MNRKIRREPTKCTVKHYKVCHEFGGLFCFPRLENQTKIRKSTSAQFSKLMEKKSEKVTDGNTENPMKILGSHQTLFHRQSSIKVTPSFTTVFLQLEKVSDLKNMKKVTFEKSKSVGDSTNIVKKEMVIALPVKSAKMVSKAVQTTYRDSEAQTMPWRHEIRVERRFLNELLMVEPFYLGTEYDFLPGLEAVTLIERAREKFAWEIVVGRLRGRENDSTRKVLVARMAETETAAREKTAAEISEKRMNMSKKLIAEEKKRWQDELRIRFLHFYGKRRTENDKKIRRWKHQLLRKVRLVKKREVRSASFKATDISNLTTPYKMFPKGQKLFDFQFKYLDKYNGLTILEKHVSDLMLLKPRQFDCGESSKPNKFGFCSKRLRHKGWKSVTLDECSEDNVPFSKVAVRRISKPSTPKTVRTQSKTEDESNQASILMVKIIKGKANSTRKVLELSKMGAGNMC